MKILANASFRRRLRQRGAIVVEMALVTTMLLLITAGIVEFGRVFWYYNALDKATRNAARHMSAVPRLDMGDAAKTATAVATAQNLVVTAVNGAHLNPALAAANVSVRCDGSACAGTVPANVSVSITGFSVTPGTWFPFVTVAGGAFGSVALSPSTTMRYMN